MKPKADKTLADFVVIAISPVLIMALVGSLVFFLAEVLYVGQYQDTLLWILFFYVFGAVLVARISIEHDAGRATMYGLILGGVTWLGMLRYVEFPPGTFAAEFGWAINLGLIGIIWWSTHKLTWDCTMIDDAADASGAGLMQTAGLDHDDTVPRGPGAVLPSKAAKEKPGLEAWWRRWGRYRDERNRQPQVPGVWVVYFSLAALPLYGLGQSLIPPADEERRRHVFWLMSVYVASGLGLLLTTSFLGLRRYLRQKKVQMPAAITGVWLLLGAAMVAAFLFLGALLPRPAAEYALIDLPWRAGSKDRDASRFAMKGNEPGKGDGRRGAAEKDDKDGAANPDRKRPGGDKSDEKGEAGGNKADPNSAKKGRDGNESAKPAPEPQQGQAEPSAGPQALPEWTGRLGTLLKWIVLGFFALVIAFLLLRGLLIFLANFTGWARNLLAFFRNWWQLLASRERKQSEDGALEPQKAAPVPFSAFPDPFLTGQADRMSPAKLVRYTFDALEAWARERDLPRQPGETPLEFAQRLAQEVPEVADTTRQLANYYAGLAYARHTLTGACRDPLRKLWQILAETAHSELPEAVPNG